MALFAIQLIRLVFYILPMEWTTDGYNYAMDINEMFNVIIRSVHIYLFCLTDNIYQGIAPTIILVRVSMRLSFDDPESFKVVFILIIPQVIRIPVVCRSNLSLKARGSVKILKDMIF